jgi:hypothetical protein
MIVYKEIPTQYVDLYHEGRLFASVNEHEFNCIRVQIKNEEAEGWYVIYEGVTLRIDKYGRLEAWPKGFFDLIEYYLSQLV